MNPTEETLGSLLLVPVPTGCPPDLAARITAHNQAAAAWQERHDRLEADWAALDKAIRERIGSTETRMAAIGALKAEQERTAAQCRELVAARLALVTEIYDRGVESRAALIFDMQRTLRRSGWPWRVAGRG